MKFGGISALVIDEIWLTVAFESLHYHCEVHGWLFGKIQFPVLTFFRFSFSEGDNDPLPKERLNTSIDTSEKNNDI
mgnify:CR=1 FL=1